MKAWGVVAALVLVAGCSSGTHHRAADPEATHAATPVAQVDDPATIGRMIGCRTALKVDTESMAQDERYCKVGTHLVAIVRGPDRETLLAYAKMGESFGANVAIVNDHWYISSMSRPLVGQLAKRNNWRLL